jgi:quercetin dioxygenase-like cupin family protein
MNSTRGLMVGLAALGALAAAGACAAAPAPPQADVAPGGAPQTVIVMRRDFAPGENAGWHIHHGVEMTYVVKGEMRLFVAGQAPRVVRAGDNFQVPRDTPHNAINEGDGPAELIVTYLIDKGGPIKIPAPDPTPSR